MSDTMQLARPRSIRFTRQTDSLLEAEAARHGKTVSELVREKLEANLGETKTAGDILLEMASHPPRKCAKSNDREAFRKSYGERHAQ